MVSHTMSSIVPVELASEQEVNLEQSVVQVPFMKKC